MKILAIIPARGGSKRLPQKNILELNGKPLIKWTIDAALECKENITVMVSTDCPDIAKIALESGAKVPYLRAAHLANDMSSSEDVVLDVIEYYRKKNEFFDTVVLLQPTSPLRTAMNISNALSLFNEKGAKAVVSVSECEHSPLWTNVLSEDLNMDGFINEKQKKIRSQDLPTYYRLNGAIYIIDVDTFINENDFMPIETFAYIMSQSESIDIDTRLDFEVAKCLMMDCK